MYLIKSVYGPRMPVTLGLGLLPLSEALTAQGFPVLVGEDRKWDLVKLGLQLTLRNS